MAWKGKYWMPVITAHILMSWISSLAQCLGGPMKMWQTKSRAFNFRPKSPAPHHQNQSFFQAFKVYSFTVFRPWQYFRGHIRWRGKNKGKENNTCLCSWSTCRSVMCCLLGNRDSLTLHWAFSNWGSLQNGILQLGDVRLGLQPKTIETSIKWKVP